MNQSEGITLPKSLKHWINSIKNPSCLLIDNIMDLQDGKCFSAIVENLFKDHKTSVEASENQMTTGRIQSVVNAVGNNVGWNNVPPELRCRECAAQLSQGDPTITIKFLQFLHKLSDNRIFPMTFNTNNSIKPIAPPAYPSNSIAEVGVTNQNSTISFGPSNTTDQFEVDSLENDSHRDVNVLTRPNEAEQRSSSPTVIFSRTPSAGAAAAHPSAVRIGARKHSPINRNTTSVLPNKIDQLSSSAGLEARAAARRRIVAHRRASQSATSRSPRGTHKTGKEYLTVPAGMSVLSEGGLTLGSSMMDPSYRPGRRKGFAETAPVSAPPPEEELSESDYSTEATQLLYERLLRGRGQRGRQGDLQKRAHINANLPHSRSISPAGRRHVHCRLATSGAPHRHPSPNEVHILSSHQTMEGDHNNEYSQHRTVTQRHPRATTKAPQPHKPATASSSRTSRKTHTHQTTAYSSTAKPNVDIDAVISTERKNVILDWLQRRLGLFFDLTVPLDASKKSVPCAYKQDNLLDTQRNSNKENESSQRESENKGYIHTHGGRKPQVFAIPTYLGRLTLEMPGFKDNQAVDTAALLQRGQEQNLKGLRYVPLHTSAPTLPFNPHSVGLCVPVTTVGFLADPWVSGVLLAEVLAALLVENRALIKQASNADLHASHSRLVLTGIELSVHSRAQATHNLHVCMEALHAHIPGFPSLDYSADDIVAGRVSLWRLLDILYEIMRYRVRSGSSGRGRGRCRSVSPDGGQQVAHVGESSGRTKRSTSVPLRGKEAAVRVSFADGQLAERSASPSLPRSQLAIPTPSAMPLRPSTALHRKQRSRSVSPMAATKRVDTAAVSLLELRRAEKEHERERARLYAQKKRQQTATKEGEEPAASPSQAGGLSGWNSSTALDKAHPRSASVSRSVTTSASKQNTEPSNPDVLKVDHPGATEQQSRVQQNPRYWYPPKLSSVEIEAARNTPLPNISVHQQRAVRDWLSSAFGIHLLDAECGFHPFSNTAQIRADDSVELLRHPRTGLPYDAKFERSHDVLSLHAPPPLPLHDDRVRNGVLLGQLLLRLEPHAALHAHIPKLIHKHPRSLPTTLENIDRVLWVFKLRRSPPLPLQYLCQPDEILKGNVPLVWGLLWEIMQAYPYANMAPIHSDDIPRSAAYGTSACSGLGGVLSATTALVAPKQNPAGNFQPPLRSGPAAEVTATHRESLLRRKPLLGLKGQEARYNVPTTARYNYADPQMEHPVAAHTLPYSDKQRHQLELSLLHWLGETGVLADIIGSLSRPLTLLALESYCRDGTLLCMILENVLGLTLSKNWNRRPASYIECMSNLKHCFDVLRKCAHLRPRYLYAGVEEDICRGHWDCILGLLEDLHRFADNIHPHAQIFHTVDTQGRIMKPNKQDKASFNYETVEAPYLGANGMPWEDEDTDSLDPVETKSIEEHQQTVLSVSKGPTETIPSRSDLLHDVTYTYVPKLDLAPPPSPIPSPKPVLAPRLEASVKDPVFSADAKEYNPHRGSGDLYPSNVVSGQNVANALGGKEDEPLFPSHSRRIPTLKRHAGHPLSRSVSQGSVDSGAQQHWVQSLTTTGAPSPLADTGADSGALSDTEAQESRRLAQALSLKSDSETETRPSPSRRARNTDRESKHLPTSQHTERSTLSSPRRSRSPSPIRLGLPPNLDSSRFHRYNRRGINSTAAGSEVDTDSLEASPSSPDSIATEDLVENVTHNIDTIKARKLLRWFKDLGIHVEHKNGNFVRDIFCNGVVLCTLIQKLERCGPIVGTFVAPHTHSECVQNVRRCLELLAMRRKSIPLRTLSCEEEVLRGDMVRTVELLMCIRKAYATYRR